MTILTAMFIIVIIIFIIIVISYLLQYGDSMWQRDDYIMTRILGFYANRGILFTTTNIIRSIGVVDSIMNKEAKRRMQIQNGSPPLSDSICFYGDSEFTTWYDLEKDMSNANFTCFNAGFGGARTTDLECHVDELCLKWDPKMVVIHAMGNDWDFASLNISCDFSSLNINCDFSEECMNKTVKNIITLVKRIEQTSSVCFLLSPRRPIYSDTKWNYMCTVASKLDDANIPLIDIRDLNHTDSHYRIDRVHLNSQGHSYKAKRILQVLTTHMENKCLYQVRQREKTSCRIFPVLF